MQRGSEEPLLLSEPDSAQQQVELMGRHPGAQATYGVGHYGAGGEMAIAERIQHGGVSTQKAAPAHAHGGEYRHLVAGDPPLADERRHQ